MRTALFLLLLLALAAVPGSLVPQRSSRPERRHAVLRSTTPTSRPILDKLQVFDVYTSVWFSSIYLLLFISLIGCVIPRTKHHFDALRAAPPQDARAARRGSPAHTTREPPTADPSTRIRAGRARCSSASGYRVASSSTTRGADGALGLGRARLPARDRQPGLPHGARRHPHHRRHRRRLRLHRPAGARRGPDLRQHPARLRLVQPGALLHRRHAHAVLAHARHVHVDVRAQNLKAFGQPLDYTADVTTDEPGGESDSATSR